MQAMLDTNWSKNCSILLRFNMFRDALDFPFKKFNIKRNAIIKYDVSLIDTKLSYVMHLSHHKLSIIHII